jgi:hypothetical protein
MNQATAYLGGKEERRSEAFTVRSAGAMTSSELLTFLFENFIGSIYFLHPLVGERLKLRCQACNLVGVVHLRQTVISG